MNTKNILNQEFEKRKSRNQNFSLRAFARYLGFSPAQLSQMMSGKRPITLNAAKKLSERFGYSPQEKLQFLKTLLPEEQANAKHPQLSLRQLQEDQFRLIADWHHLAILTLAKIKGAKADPCWVARRLGITNTEAHQAMLRLIRLGLLQTKPHFAQIGNPFEVSSQISSEAIQKYHRQNLNLSMEKLEMISVKKREYQSISIPVCPKKLKAYKKLIDDFLEQAMELSHQQDGSEVYHLNVQLFPVTKSKELENAE